MRLVLGVAVALLAAGCAAPGDDGAAPPLVLGVVGHSMLRGYNQDAAHMGDHPESSWPSGEAEWTFRARAGAVAAENVAQPGARVAAMTDQVAALEEATFVLVSFGANDACALGPEGPTPPDAFERSLRDGVRALVARGGEVLLLSEVDLTAIHAAAAPPEVGPHASFYALFGPACGTPETVRARLSAYNEAIARVATEEGARDDGGAQWRVAWRADMVSRVDGLHPSEAGARVLAETAWNASLARAP